MFGLYIDRDEAVQITISVLAISLAMALFFAGLDGMLASPLEFLVFVPAILVTVGSGFILHEMAHKLVALEYGAQARFRMWNGGLAVMFIAIVVFGVFFAAPGAVYIYAPRITARQNGLISIAGPLLNFTLAIFFVALEFVAPVRQFFTFLAPAGLAYAGYGISNGMLHVWRFGAAMNLVLGLFNMIPAFVLDGAKVFRWNRFVWGGFLLLLMGLGYLIAGPGIIIGWVIMATLLWVLSKFFFG